MSYEKQLSSAPGPVVSRCLFFFLHIFLVLYSIDYGFLILNFGNLKTVEHRKRKEYICARITIYAFPSNHFLYMHARHYLETNREMESSFRFSPSVLTFTVSHSLPFIERKGLVEY